MANTCVLPHQTPARSGDRAYIAPSFELSPMKSRPKRLRRLDRVWLNDGQPTYFITICALNRRPILANDAVHTRLRQFLLNTANHHDWWAGRYVLMSDHLHLLATPGLGAVTLGEWIKALKAVVANRQFKWQRGFFDHVMRSDESQSEKWEYIRHNPVRAGLVAHADAWAFGGEIDWAQGDAAPPPRRETRPASAGAPSIADRKPIDHAQANVGPVSRPGGTEGVASRSTNLTHYHPITGAETRLDNVAVEEPLEIRIEGHSVAVVMRTPGHDRELAAGFLVSENLIHTVGDIFDITQCGSREGQVVNVTLRNPAAFEPAKLTRNVFTSSSCGVCSKATIEAVRQAFSPVESDCRVTAKVLLSLPALLREQQATFNQTGGVHACALFDVSGRLEALREDVGRHNALDKLIGWALLANLLPLRDRLLLLSGRVSFEMMQKALAAGIPIVAAISAPTTLAVEFARENNQTLVGFIRGETMNIYAEHSASRRERGND